jgi:hypothetical protein
VGGKSGISTIGPHLTVKIVHNYIQHKLFADKIPGAAQVQAGNFYLSRDGASKALSKTNWTASTFPGVTLNMTVVFALMQVQLRRCPRPSCGRTISDTIEASNFITCPSCQLTFRFDPDVTGIGLQAAEEKLKLYQQNHDLNVFGRRPTPVEVVELPPDSEESDMQSNGVQVTAINTQPKAGDGGSEDSSQAVLADSEIVWNDDEGSKDSIARPDRLDRGEDEDGDEEEEEEEEEVNDPDVDQDLDYDPSLINAWLDHSVLPAAPNAARHSPVSDEASESVLRQQEEAEALNSLTRVQFIQKRPETRPLQDTVETYSDMPLDAQIYLRKIVDRFPTLPPFLAKRFARANVQRADRLKAMSPSLAVGS